MTIIGAKSGGGAKTTCQRDSCRALPRWRRLLSPDEPGPAGGSL